MIMGGNNGFTDFKFILGADIRSAAVQRDSFHLHRASCCCSSMSAAAGSPARGLAWSSAPFATARRACSSAAIRSRASSSSSLSSARSSPPSAARSTCRRSGIINPSEMTTDKSLEAVVWCAVGGRGTLIGPIIGAVGVNALKSWATREFPDAWLSSSAACLSWW